jgi:hypothetical protein
MVISTLGLEETSRSLVIMKREDNECDNAHVGKELSAEDS